MVSNAQWAVEKALELNQVDEISGFYAANAPKDDVAAVYTLHSNIEGVAHDLYGMVDRVQLRQKTNERVREVLE